MYLEEVTMKLVLAHLDPLDILHQNISPVQISVLKLNLKLRHCQSVSNLKTTLLFITKFFLVHLLPNGKCLGCIPEHEFL